MSEPGKKKATYEDLYTIPEHMTGEIIDGELLVTPRPARNHTLAVSLPGGEVIPPIFTAAAEGQADGSFSSTRNWGSEKTFWSRTWPAGRRSGFR